ncbi:MAG: hypothetical protein U0Q15_05505 [Kineosporiaceae bacterium]
MATRYLARTVAFVGWLIFRSPELLPILQEHLDDNDGEILPHVLLFRIREYIEFEFEKEGESELVRAAVESLKAGLVDGDYELLALIQTSFIDDISAEPHPAAALKRALRAD